MLALLNLGWMRLHPRLACLTRCAWRGKSFSSQTPRFKRPETSASQPTCKSKRSAAKNTHNNHIIHSFRSICLMKVFFISIHYLGQILHSLKRSAHQYQRHSLKSAFSSTYLYVITLLKFVSTIGCLSAIPFTSAFCQLLLSLCCRPQLSHSHDWILAESVGRVYESNVFSTQLHPFRGGVDLLNTGLFAIALSEPPVTFYAAND